MKFLPKLYHTIRNYFTSKDELLWLFKRQLEITDINFRRIYEDNGSFPNGTALICTLELLNMDVARIYISLWKPNLSITFNAISQLLYIQMS